MRTEPEIARAIGNNLADDIVRQSFIDAKACEFSIPKAQQPASKSADPDGAIILGQQRPDGLQRIGVGGGICCYFVTADAKKYAICGTRP
jgi:hypothetical protein